jgi:hypothetical protein
VLPPGIPNPSWGAAYAAKMNKAGGYLLSKKIAPLWIGEFGNDTGSLANFGLAPSSDVGSAASGVWWSNLRAWVTGNDIDWCWWALNPHHGKATTPAVMTMLQEMIRPSTGPGVN